MHPTLSEFACRYRHAVFTASRLISMADEARVSGLPEAHDALIKAADEYKKSFIEIRTAAFKAFPEEAPQILSFNVNNTEEAPPDEPSA